MNLRITPCKNQFPPLGRQIRPTPRPVPLRVPRYGKRGR